MNPVDKREATRRGTLLLSRECRLIYYTARRAEFQLCALPGSTPSRRSGESRGSEMFLERLREKCQKAPLPSGQGGFSLLSYDNWIKIGGAFERTKL
jgi:hypothetical protein